MRHKKTAWVTLFNSLVIRIKYTIFALLFEEFMIVEKD